MKSWKGPVGIPGQEAFPTGEGTGIPTFAASCVLWSSSLPKSDYIQNFVSCITCEQSINEEVSTVVEWIRSFALSLSRQNLSFSLARK